MSEGESQAAESMTLETESQPEAESETLIPKVEATIETPPPAPKKRGRPPLNPEAKKLKELAAQQQQQTPEQPAVVPEKRKRGRPPKPKPEPFVVPDSEDVRPEKPDSMVTDSEEPKPVVPLTPEVPVKRGRGRPRKTPPIGPPEPALKPSLEKVPKKRGRPRKSEPSEDEQAKKKQKLMNDEEKPKKREDLSRQRNSLKFRQTRNSTDKTKKGAGDASFPHKVNVSVGADSSTGPGFYSVSIVNCTLNSEQLTKAYRDGSEKLGFDLQKEVCTTNHNCSLSLHHFKALATAGIPVLDGDDGGDDASDFELTLDSYRDIWLHIARLGNSSLVWAVAEFDALPIGGNGLFGDLVDQRDKPEPTGDQLGEPEIVQT